MAQIDDAPLPVSEEVCSLRVLSVLLRAVASYGLVTVLASTT